MIPLRLYAWAALFLAGFAVCWPIGSYRVQRVQLEWEQKVNQQQKDALEAWQKQSEKNLADTKQLLASQTKINDTSARSQQVLQQSIMGVQDAAKKLSPTGIVFDAGHQQLLHAITQVANSSIAVDSEASSTAGSTIPDTRVSRVKHQ